MLTKSDDTFNGFSTIHKWGDRQTGVDRIAIAYTMPTYNGLSG